MSIFSPAPGTSTPAFPFYRKSRTRMATRTSSAGTSNRCIGLSGVPWPWAGYALARALLRRGGSSLLRAGPWNGGVPFRLFWCWLPAIRPLRPFALSATAPIAPAPFFSALPKELLAHKNGGALAVIGHTERAWLTSLAPSGAGVQVLPSRMQSRGHCPIAARLRNQNLQ
jgi:hypothetical protein